MKKTSWQRPLLWGQKRKSTRKKIRSKFIRINTSKEDYDTDYEASRIQTFINKFKDRQLKKIKQKNKRTRRQHRKIDRLNHSIK